MIVGATVDDVQRPLTLLVHTHDPTYRPYRHDEALHARIAT